MDWNVLLRDFLECNSTDRLLQDAGTMLGCPLMVVDDTFHVIASYVPEGFHDGAFDAALTRGEITYEAISALHWDLMPDPTAGVFQLVEDSGYTRRFSCLANGGMRVGYLICVDVNENLAQVPQEQFHGLEALLAKQILCQDGRNRAYGTTVEEVLANLLDGKFSEPGAFYVQAMTTDLAQDQPERLALINLGLYHSFNFRDDALKQALNQAFGGAHPFLYRGEVLLLLKKSHPLAALDTLAQQYRLRVVVSDQFSDLYLLPQHYHAAREVMEYLLPLTGPLVTYTEQFRTLLLMHQLAQRPVLTDPRIRKLAAYDREQHTQFCLTLYTYLICHHSVQETCARLFTHRNTILYRLRKLRDDFALPLDDPDQTVPLLLSSGLMLLQNHQDRLFVQAFHLEQAPGREGWNLQEP